MKKNKQKITSNPFPAMEQEVLDFWDKAKTFKKSLLRPGGFGGQAGDKHTPNPSQEGNIKEYVFYDGPPFGTGEPHYGHILSSVSKDVVPRYWTMRGYRVERRWGWDCHGLPIENIIEQDKKISGKKEIEKMGVDKFNEACRSRVLEYADIWGKMVKRIGRWIEFEDSYKTMDLSYMESVWWAFKELWKKDLIYQGRKVLLYCPRCETPISNFEVAMDNSYQDITEPSVYVKFKIKYRHGTTGRGIGGLIFNKKNEVLLIHRNEDGRRKTWALPGGKLEPGETYEQALKRELVEELGVKVKSAKPICAQPDIFEGRLFETVNYKVEVEGKPEIKIKEIDKIEWFNLDNLPEIDYPPSKDVLDNYNTKGEAFFFDIDVKNPLSSVNILAWTTTPWTLPGNVALAIGKDITYSMIKIDNEFFVLAKNRLEVIKKKYELVKEVKGKELIGLNYQPLFDLPVMRESNKKVYYVAPADFVTTDDGAGVVHTAVVYGEDDYNLGLKLDLPIIPALDEKGYFNKTVPQLKDVYFKDADKLIIKDLEKRGLLFSKEDYTHSYPFCHRCATQLFYNAIPAWFLNIDKIRKRMLELNKKINWFPKHLKEGRFAQGIEQAPDWNISRNRYFATPMPIWQCDKCDEREVISSVKELEEKSGKKKIEDIHSHFIDDLTWGCSKCKGEMKRIKEVFDCWVESGSMPFAQMYYPFENKEKFEKNFPAQFISEYISQTRAWFYVMHVLSTALFDSNSFENVVTTGVIFNEKGEKMSKSKKNYPDPWEVIDEYGVDALRFYLMSSSLMHAENLFFNEEELKDVFRKNIMILWNVYKFYEMYADKPTPDPSPSNTAGRREGNKKKLESKNILDKWIIAKINQLIKEVIDNMNDYDLPRASRPITEFINDLSTWYLRRSRDRFKVISLRESPTTCPKCLHGRRANGAHANENNVYEKDKESALQTTGFVLLQLAKVIAPFMPFIAEQLWQKVSGNNFKNEDKSVHLEEWPVAGTVNDKILNEMEIVRKIVELGLAKRDEAEIRVRQPLQKLEVRSNLPAGKAGKLEDDYIKLIKDEVNVKEVEFKKGAGEISVELDIKLTNELKQEGIKREIVRFLNAMRKQAGMTIQDKAYLFWQTNDKFIKEAILKNAAGIMQDTLASEMDEEKSDKVDLAKKVKVNDIEVWLGIKKK